ncbi:MAG TPA: helix-turn-helix domain-containing protein [Bacteroidota bacterium]|nr:helix-turn-helix domain-containing protein [Bacteroidota bacterium]
MRTREKKRLLANGWKFGSATDFLNLSAEEAAYVEIKVALSRIMQKRRKRKGITQVQLAKMLESSQSRVAKMESCDPSVSLDLLIRSLLVLGVRTKSVLRALPG